MTLYCDSVLNNSTILGVVFDCGTLEDPENGSVDLSDGTTEGSTATYTCFTGYQLKGVSTRVCTSSGWSDREPTCERKRKLLHLITHSKIHVYSTILFLSMYVAVNCGTLGSPDFGQVSWTSTFFNGVATYSCFTGYVLIGQRERRCEEDGNWSGQPPQCEREYYLALYNYMACYASEKQRYEMNS